MIKDNTNNSNKKFDFRLRTILLGTPFLILLSVASLYVALRLGALPWPTVFVAVISSSLFRLFKNSDINEINCSHTFMSAGSMVAGGVAFTLPGLWILSGDNNIPFITVLVSTIVGVLLGVFFTFVYRKILIEKQNLPYPIGEVTHKILLTYQEKSKAIYLYISILLSAVFTFIRDFFKKIPSVITFYKGGRFFAPFMMYVSPMALSIGAMIGEKLALFWGLGMIVSNIILIPILVSSQVFDTANSAISFTSSLALGILIGCGLAAIIIGLYKSIKSHNKKDIKTKNLNKYKQKNIVVISIALMIICAILLSISSELNIFVSIITVLSIALTTFIASLLTGQTGINPMEVFAIMTVLFVRLLSSNSSLVSLFTIAVAVAVATGLSGDIMNDYKVGYTLGTKTKSLLISELIGGLIASVVVVVSIFIIKKGGVQFGTAEYPAVQASNVALSIKGFSHPLAFYIGLIVGAVMYGFSLPASVFALGMYLPNYITITVIIGALIMFVCKKCKNKNISYKAELISSGFLGGEGASGVIIAFITLFTSL